MIVKARVEFEREVHYNYIDLPYRFDALTKTWYSKKTGKPVRVFTLAELSKEDK